MAIEFSKEELVKIEEIKSHYPSLKSALLPVLWLAQKKFGWISNEVIKYVGNLLGIPYSHVLGVASFYTMFFKKPMGKYHIQVCRTLSCHLRGAEQLVAMLKELLGIGLGQITPDGLFSLAEVECLGSCGTAPMMQINEDYHENLTRDRVNQILSELRDKAHNG